MDGYYAIPGTIERAWFVWLKLDRQCEQTPWRKRKKCKHGQAEERREEGRKQFACRLLQNVYERAVV